MLKSKNATEINDDKPFCADFQKAEMGKMNESDMNDKRLKMCYKKDTSNIYGFCDNLTTITLYANGKATFDMSYFPWLANSVYSNKYCSKNDSQLIFTV